MHYKSKLSIAILSLSLIASAHAENVKMTFQSSILSLNKSDENSSQPNTTLFPNNQAVSLCYTYDTAASSASIEGGIATYNLTGTFSITIGDKVWTASACKLRVGDYADAVTPTDLLELEFVATPPSGFTEENHVIHLSLTGNPAPENLTTGNALPNTTNVPNLASCSSFQICIRPQTAAATLIPWVVQCSKPSSVEIIAL